MMLFQKGVSEILQGNFEAIYIVLLAYLTFLLE